MQKTIKDLINEAGSLGSIERLKFISKLSPSKYPPQAIEAAQRCVKKREARARRLD